MRRPSTTRDGGRGSFFSQSGIRMGDSMRSETGQLRGFRAAIFPEPKCWLQRTGHTIVVYKGNTVLFGGVGPGNVYSPSLFFNAKMTLQWKERRGVGIVPAGRANHSSILLDNKMYVFGGHRDREVFDDLFVLNLDTLRWEKLGYERIQGPGPVFSHAAVFIPPTQLMIIIGGFHQRKHNMYIAHSFDVRNRTWSGISAPDSVNPHHIQLVTAVYHHQSTSLVVVGMTKKSNPMLKASDMPSIFLMNIYSYFWTEVTTSLSPSTTIMFSMPLVWDHLMMEHIRLSFMYEEKRQELYFPLRLGAFEYALNNDDEGRRTGNLSMLGQSSRSILRSATSTKESEGGGEAKLNDCVILRLQLTNMTWSMLPVVVPRRVLSKLITFRVECREGRIAKRMHMRHRGRTPQDKKSEDAGNLLFSSYGVSQYERKYVLTPVSYSLSQKAGPEQKNIFMHGGMPEDNIAVLLTPMFRGNTGDSNSIDLTCLFNDSVSSNATLLGAESSYPTKHDFGGFSTDAYEVDSRGSETTGSSADVGSTRPDSKQGCNIDQSYTFPSGFRASVDASSARGLRSGPSGVLRPQQQFTLLHHPSNATGKLQQLPDGNCPVAVVNSDKDVLSWAENFFQDTREWVVKNVLAVREEDKKERRQRSRARKGRRGFLAEDDDDLDMSSGSMESRGGSEARSTAMNRTFSQFGMTLSSQTSGIQEPKDFFLEKNLVVFNMREDLEDGLIRGFRKHISDSLQKTGAVTRMSIKAKRLPEINRLPFNVFGSIQRENTAGAACLAAYSLMEAALARNNDGTPASRRQRTLIRWRYLRVMVLNGEASTILFYANIEEKRTGGLSVSSSARIALAPEVCLRGLQGAKVPTRPIPYTIPPIPSMVCQPSVITKSGYTLYSCVLADNSGKKKKKGRKSPNL
uniref:Uncharacterized protein n=1 Tax=Trypanosoma congolense (strain IL3000) TaxID=1068625 RepID=G0UWG3_TRYCI|nr:conserved hypothetical protein [Trypanosoma congolense IL3000]